MGITWQMFLAVCGGGSAIATGIFWGAYYLGKYIARLEAVEVKVEHHDRIITSWKGV
jgi:hypothetical protein